MSFEASYYNVVVPRDDSYIIYHTDKRTLAELDQDDYEALMHPDGADPDRVAALVKQGFLVPSAEGEAEGLVYRQHRYRNNKRIFELTITPSRECNFACPYCYILKRPGSMSPEVQQLVIDYVIDSYEKTPFRELKINWYGGEPMLQIDIMENISGPLIAFCKEHGVKFVGHMLSNGSLADAEMSRRLVENCGIYSVMPTISGKGDMQDYQRCGLDGDKHFDELMANVDHMRDAGILVHLNYVTNKNNIDGCTELASELYHKSHIVTRLSKTGSFGKPLITLEDGEDTPMELFSLEEFAEPCARFWREMNMGVKGYEEVLQPQKLYCAAYVSNGWFIDEIGDVTKCMVDMDYPERTLFNLKDWKNGTVDFKWDRFLDFARQEPCRAPVCRTCNILPICQGGCALKRITDYNGVSCHNLRYAIDEVVSDYFDACLAEGSKSGSAVSA